LDLFYIGLRRLVRASVEVLLRRREFVRGTCEGILNVNIELILIYLKRSSWGWGFTL